MKKNVKRQKVKKLRLKRETIIGHLETAIGGIGSKGPGCETGTASYFPSCWCPPPI
jgi:hypothetical protein